MKKSLMSLATLIISTGFVSAYSDPLRDIFDSIGPTTFTLGAVFIASFALLYFALTKTFKKEKTTPGILALVIALLITYSANRSNFDLEQYLYFQHDINFSTILFILVIIGIAIWIIKAEKKL